MHRKSFTVYPNTLLVYLNTCVTEQMHEQIKHLFQLYFT